MPRKRAAVVEAETVVVVAEPELDEPGFDEPGFDEEACRQRAYEISMSEDAGTPEENWIRAEAELRGAAAGAEA